MTYGEKNKLEMGKNIYLKKQAEFEKSGKGMGRNMQRGGGRGGRN
jgi:hypothetical protein